LYSIDDYSISLCNGFKVSNPELDPIVYEEDSDFEPDEEDDQTFEERQRRYYNVVHLEDLQRRDFTLVIVDTPVNIFATR
jgi:hypothetical protein